MRLTSLPARLRATLGGQDGFSMLTVLFVMIAAGAFVTAGYAAAQSDLPISRNSQDRKVAYAAAESGVQYYQHRLDADNDFWLKCDAPVNGQPTPVNQPWDGKSPVDDPRVWRTIPGSTAQFTIELVPTAPATQCVQNDATSVTDPISGGVRIRVTGRPSPTSTVRRTINANFRRDSFLDFLYFTDFETLDPAAYGSNSSWASTNCAKKRAYRHASCSEIQFAGFDQIKGPFHTNDDILTCGDPIFGRTSADKIEVMGAAPGWKNNTGCTGAPQFKGPFTAGAQEMFMPPTNAKLEAIAESAYTFTGKTTIRFHATGGMTVTNAGLSGGVANMALPPNGVIYVRNGTCVDNISPLVATYGEGAGCAQVYVSGTYTDNVTIGSKKDIIIAAPDGTDNGDLVKADNSVVLGLIAENYVRVAHPIDGNGNNVTTGGGRRVMPSVKIDAAILSLTHSFLVDRWPQGAKLGKLTVNGAIAQKFRGPVGTTAPSGYEKDYNYDDRLRFRSPPYFLDPVATRWRVIRTNEQVPGRYPAD
jgi:hypothetical protein